jgi:IS30 family transposase
MERTYSQIDMDERRKITRWKTAGISVTVIAEKLVAIGRPFFEN